jgi:hypothetical protein
MLATVAIHAPRNSRAGGGGEYFAAKLVSSAASNRAAGNSRAAAPKNVFQFMPWANETRRRRVWQRFFAAAAAGAEKPAVSIDKLPIFCNFPSLGLFNLNLNGL